MTAKFGQGSNTSAFATIIQLSKHINDSTKHGAAAPSNVEIATTGTPIGVQVALIGVVDGANTVFNTQNPYVSGTVTGNQQGAYINHGVGLTEVDSTTIEFEIAPDLTYPVRLEYLRA